MRHRFVLTALFTIALFNAPGRALQAQADRDSLAWRAAAIDSAISLREFANPHVDHRYFIQWDSLGLAPDYVSQLRDRFPHILNGDARADRQCSDLNVRVHNGCWNIELKFIDSSDVRIGRLPNGLEGRFGATPDSAFAVIESNTSAWWVDGQFDERFHSYKHHYRVNRQTGSVELQEVSHGTSVPDNRYVLPAKRKSLLRNQWAMIWILENEAGLSVADPSRKATSKILVLRWPLDSDQREKIAREVTAGRWWPPAKWVAELPTGAYRRWFEHDASLQCDSCTYVRIDSIAGGRMPTDTFTVRVSRARGTGPDEVNSSSTYRFWVENAGRAGTRLVVDSLPEGGR